MLTGEIRSQVDQIWNAFWTGGISNPLEVIEQITYLLFIKRLDELHTLEENKARTTKKPIERRVFPEGKDVKKRLYDDLRWSRLKNFAPSPKRRGENCKGHIPLSSSPLRFGEGPGEGF